MSSTRPTVINTYGQPSNPEPELLKVGDTVYTHYAREGLTPVAGISFRIVNIATDQQTSSGFYIRAREVYGERELTLCGSWWLPCDGVSWTEVSKAKAAIEALIKWCDGRKGDWGCVPKKLERQLRNAIK